MKISLFNMKIGSATFEINELEGLNFTHEGVHFFMSENAYSMDADGSLQSALLSNRFKRAKWFKSYAIYMRDDGEYVRTNRVFKQVVEHNFDFDITLTKKLTFIADILKSRGKA